MWNNKKISKSLNDKGYYAFNNYLSKSELKKIQSTLLKTLNYIKPSSQKIYKKNIMKLKILIIN